MEKNINQNVDKLKIAKTVSAILGILLVLSVINSIYTTVMATKGYKTAEAICIHKDTIYERSIDNDRITSYSRGYKYIVDGKEYELYTNNTDKTVYKYIKYDPSNPNKAVVFDSYISTSNINILIIGIALLIFPAISSIKKLPTIDLKAIKFSKRKILKIITICFWVYITISFINTSYSIFQETKWNELEISTTDVVINLVIFSVVFTLIKNLQIIFIYLAIKFGTKKFKNQKLSKIDFGKYKEYYRDIINEYSPAELSYVDNFEINYKNDIVATLLSLKLKNKINFDESQNRITVINDNLEGLSGNEKFILNSISNGKVVISDEETFESEVKENAVKNKLLKKDNIYVKALVGSLIISFLISIFAIFPYILGNIFTEFDPSKFSDSSIFTIMLICMILFCLPIFLVTAFFTYLSKSAKNNYCRTSTGEDVNEKLEGLKNYLKDYSSIDEMDENGLALWEDYLIYSVIFNQNDTVVKNISEKYISI